MTDRERLIGLLSEYDFDSTFCNICERADDDCAVCGSERLADYLIEHGVIVPPETGIGNVSDGYHTFNELYHHRAVLFSVICNIFKDKAWKSKKHDTGDMYDGMFIVGIETPQGQATYHYDINPYWDMFEVKELPKAPKWDGHTPEEAIRRISILQVDNVIVLPCKVGDKVYELTTSEEIKQRKVKDIIYDNEGFRLRLEPYFSYEYYLNETVFLTREEAEEKLKECKRNV